MIGGVTRRVSSPTFVGRAVELDRLASALERASDGHPSLVLVGGEAGVGKSRLLRELVSSAGASGVLALVGACLDLGEGGLPFAPFTEALRDWARRLPPAAAAEVVGSFAAPLATLLPDLGAVPPAIRADLDPASGQARLFDAVLAILGRLASDRSALLVLEDLHWADGSTRDLIRFLVRNVRDERLLIVATYRTDELHRRHPLLPLLSELERSDRTERIELRAFGRAELREQLAGITGTQPTDDAIDSVLRRSDGIPFYVEELVAGMGDGTNAIPASLREILGLRLASLPGNAQGVVRAASVVGVRVPLDRLVAVVDVEGSVLDEALRAAIDAGVLVSARRPDGASFDFRHALLRETAYEDLLPTEQVRLHGRLADYLAAHLAGDPSDAAAVVGDLAFHAYNAGDQPGALGGAVRAMHDLAQTGAFREALAHVERALELWPRVPDAAALTGTDRVTLLALAARMAGNGAQPAKAVRLGQEALRELGVAADPGRAASVLVDLWSAAWEAEDDTVAQSSADQLAGLVDRLPAARLKALALLLCGFQSWSRGQNRASVTWHEQALEVARLLADEPMRSMAAGGLAHSLSLLGRCGRAATVLAGTAPRAEFYDATPWLYWTAEDRHAALWWLGRFEEAIAVVRDAIPIAARYGLEQRVGPWLSASDSLYELGRVDEAVESERAGIAATGNHRFQGEGSVETQRAVLRGDVELARRSIEARTADDVGTMWTLELAAMLARAEGDIATVRSVVDEAFAAAEGGDVDGILWRVLDAAIAAAADAAVDLGRRRQHAELERVRSDGRRWFDRLRMLDDAARADGGSGAFLGAMLTTAEAELGRMEGNSDPAAWSRVVDSWLALSHVQRVAEARLRFAEATLATGADRHSAAAALHDALAAAASLGAKPLVEAIQALARRARIELDGASNPVVDESLAPPPAAAPTLTNRERDVLGLVAAGHTNREIGDRLFITEKTVSVHVSNAMAKLGALSRYEAAAAAERLAMLR
jgi:DNA-binding CsgD family transcriptional regulator